MVFGEKIDFQMCIIGGSLNPPNHLEQTTNHRGQSNPTTQPNIAYKAATAATPHPTDNYGRNNSPPLETPVWAFKHL